MSRPKTIGRVKPIQDKLAAGRPRKEPPADVLQVIEASCALGASSKQALAMATGVCRDVFERWMTETPAIQESVRAGTEKERQILHSVLYNKAMDGGKDSLIASMFLLKSRHGYREGEQESQAARLTINFSLPGAMKLEKFTIENNDSASPAIDRLSTKCLTRS
jgi:hypothetical protein